MFCENNFAAGGLAIVRSADGELIVITVAVKSSPVDNRKSTNTVDVFSVVENCGAASFCNAYRQRPVTSSVVPGGPPVLSKNATPVQFGRSLDPAGTSAVDRLLRSGRVAGFLRLQVILPRAGATQESAFKHVPAGDDGTLRLLS